MKLHEEFAYADFLTAKKESSAMMKYIDKCYINEADISLLLEDDTVNISSDDANKITGTIKKFADQLQKYLTMFLKFMGNQYTKQRLDYLNTNEQELVNRASNSTIKLDSCPNYNKAMANLEAFKVSVKANIENFNVNQFLNSTEDANELKAKITKELYRKLIPNIDVNAESLSDEAKLYLMGGKSEATPQNPKLIKDLDFPNIIKFMKAYETYEKAATDLIDNQAAAIQTMVNKLINSNATVTANAGTQNKQPDGAGEPGSQAKPDGAEKTGSDNTTTAVKDSASILAQKYRSIIQEEFLNEAKIKGNPNVQGATVAKPKKGQSGAVAKPKKGQGGTVVKPKKGKNINGANGKGDNGGASPQGADGATLTVSADDQGKNEQKKINEMQKLVADAAIEASKGCIKAYLGALSQLTNDAFELCKLLVPINILVNNAGTGQQVVNNQQAAQQPQSQPAPAAEQPAPTPATPAAATNPQTPGKP